MRIALALVLAAALAACRRPRPSPEYEEARQRHAALLARSPLDAYSLPEMDGVLGLLERVPKDSLDAESAAGLRQHILDERKAAAEELARRARIVEGAGAPTPEVGMAAGAPAAPVAAEVAAATAARSASALAPGTALEDFEKSHGRCFERRSAARLAQRDGTSVAGEAWALRDDESCRKANPAEVDRLVLFSEGKLVQVREASEAKVEKLTERVEGVRRPDGTFALPEGTRLPPGATVTWEQAPATARPAATR